MTRFLLAGAIAALASISAASAQDLSAEIGVVSDYRYRGLSLSGSRPAVQASLAIEHESGWYAEAWFSTLGASDPTAVEFDLSGGLSKDLAANFGVEVSGNYVLYPAAPADSYFEATAAATIRRGAVSARFGASLVPPQRTTGRGGNAYGFGEIEVALAPITLKTSMGYERGAFDEARHGGKWDWSVGGEVESGRAKFGLDYVGSSAGDQALVASLSGEF